MKNILLLLIAFTMIGCSEDGAEALIANSIEGTWLEVAQKLDAQDEWSYMDCTEFQLSFKHTYNADGSYQTVNGCNEAISTPITGSYTLTNGVLATVHGEHNGTSIVQFVDANHITVQSYSNDFMGEIRLLEKQ